MAELSSLEKKNELEKIAIKLAPRATEKELNIVSEIHVDHRLIDWFIRWREFSTWSIYFVKKAS